MLTLFFDTETTGLPLWDKPSEDPAQPHIVQISAMGHDEKGEKVYELNKIIKPEGWNIPDEVAKIHGITQARAEAEGEPGPDILGAFASIMMTADLIVGHGVAFDMRMMRIAAKRHALCDADLLEKRKTFCTMRAATPLCKLPPTDKMIAAGRNTFKTPKLGEAYKFFFNEELAGAHNSQVDMEACARIYYAMTRKKAA